MKLTDLFSRDRSQKKTAVAAKDELPSDAKSEQLEMRQNTSNDERLAAAKERHKQGGITEAEAVYRNILEIDPEHADARHMVGIVCLGRGEASEAEQHFRQAIALDDKQSVYYSNLGSALGAQNRTAEALDCFTRALDLNPENLGALSNAATALLSIGRANEAKPLCLKILAMQPDNVGARLNLAAAYIEEHEIHAGITVLREGLAIQPHNVDLLFQLASALEFVNQLDEASAVIEKLEALESGLARVSLLSGLVARRQGNFDIAEARLQLAIEQGLSEGEKTEAFNQLGLTLDAAGRAHEAFAAFQQSNQAMRRVVGEKAADGSGYLRDVAAIRNYFTQEKIAALGDARAADGDPQPVFFVGFPRSGTTLMEQVFMAHPKLITTEEHSPLSAVVREVRRSLGGYPQGLSNLTADNLTRLRQYFYGFCLDAFGELGDKQLVDKLPLNIVHLGLAKSLFPQAKIVVALRDPRDACVSCFMQKFRINDAMANFLDLHTTGLTYQAVMGLWLHYRSYLGDSWLEYRYESLVENFDETVTEVLDFIGVGWHEDIAHYRQAAKKRVITTPSYRDVTGPVNSRALDRWRRYEQELAPILPLLEPFVDVFGYSK
ncbi:MAG: sulfotransferase [Gammaproteobacteria bacterium]|nr:sulfotransferase [Gammaproteobacteria bacterium]